MKIMETFKTFVFYPKARLYMKEFKGGLAHSRSQSLANFSGARVVIARHAKLNVRLG